MRKVLYFSIIFFLSITFVHNAQSIYKRSIKIDNITHDIRFLDPGSIPYFSTLDFAKQFDINYYYAVDKKKIELKFDTYYLKFTAKNPFVVMTENATKRSEVIQLPLSTFLLKDEIFVPFHYALPLIEKCMGSEVSIDNTPINREDKDPIVITHETSSINNITVKELANGLMITIDAGKPVEHLEHNFANNNISLSMNGLTLDDIPAHKSYSNEIVTGINTFNESDGCSIELKTGDRYDSYEVIHDPTKSKVIVTVHSNKFSKNTVKNTTDKNDWKFDVVVIDPGHGGHDPGAIGVNGAIEKKINLQVALKLGKLIEQQMPDVKVVYTRSDDTFIELHKRGKIANKHGGKLFISLHCNSIDPKPSRANGFEFWLLRPGRTDEAIRIAEVENSVIKYEENPDQYQELTDENFILVSMAHAAYMQYSEKFAALLNDSYSNKTNLRNRGVKQAGLIVLVGASMPNVLVEMGFISNTRDAKYLMSTAGQDAIALSLLESIKEYRNYYELMMKE